MVQINNTARYMHYMHCLQVPESDAANMHLQMDKVHLKMCCVHKNATPLRKQQNVLLGVKR